MTQRIIVIHGRSTKPAKKPFEALQKKALIQGVAKRDPRKAKKITDGKVELDFVYYGDVNNRLLANNPKHKKQLVKRDPSFGNALCTSHTGFEQSIDDLGKIKRYTKADYQKILRNNKDFRWLDDVAQAVSTLAALASATILNMQVISRATADMGAYLLTQKVGSEIRTRLQKPLIKAMIAGDDICLISHSMGCIVAYDVLWKFSHMSEYANLRTHNPMVNLWVTLGSPLGEAGVKRNLVDGHKHGDDRYPNQIIKDWMNIAAKDDFIAHDSTMRDDYKKMRTRGNLKSITDKKIYNCYAKDGVSNPHKLYGYLTHTLTGQTLVDWIK